MTISQKGRPKRENRIEAARSPSDKGGGCALQERSSRGEKESHVGLFGGGENGKEVRLIYKGRCGGEGGFDWNIRKNSALKGLQFVGRLERDWGPYAAGGGGGALPSNCSFRQGIGDEVISPKRGKKNGYSKKRGGRRKEFS